MECWKPLDYCKRDTASGPLERIPRVVKTFSKVEFRQDIDSCLVDSETDIEYDCHYVGSELCVQTDESHPQHHPEIFPHELELSHPSFSELTFPVQIQKISTQPVTSEEVNTFDEHRFGGSQTG